MTRSCQRRWRRKVVQREQTCGEDDEVTIEVASDELVVMGGTVQAGFDASGPYDMADSLTITPEGTSSVSIQ